MGVMMIFPLTSRATSVTFLPVSRSSSSSQVFGSVTAKLLGPALITLRMIGVFLSPLKRNYRILI